jgi:hypothetical protein
MIGVRLLQQLGKPYRLYCPTWIQAQWAILPWPSSREQLTAEGLLNEGATLLLPWRRLRTTSTHISDMLVLQCPTQWESLPRHSYSPSSTQSQIRSNMLLLHLRNPTLIAAMRFKPEFVVEAF